MHIVLSSPVGTGCLAPNWYHDVITDLRHFFVRTGRRERVCDESESSMVNVGKSKLANQRAAALEMRTV